MLEIRERQRRIFDDFSFFPFALWKLFSLFSTLLVITPLPIFIFLSAIYFLYSIFLFPFFIFSLPFSSCFYFFFLPILPLFLLSSLVASHFLHSSFIASFLSSFFLHLINFLLLILFSFFLLSPSTLLRYPPLRSTVLSPQYGPSSISDSVWNSVIKDRGRFFGAPQPRYYVIGFPPFKGPSDSIDTAESRITRKGFPSVGRCCCASRRIYRRYKAQEDGPC